MSVLLNARCNSDHCYNDVVLACLSQGRHHCMPEAKCQTTDPFVCCRVCLQEGHSVLVFCATIKGEDLPPSCIAAGNKLDIDMYQCNPDALPL